MTPWFDLPDAKTCGWHAPGDVAIIGAGLAGLCTARALLSAGFHVTLYEADDHVAAGASASPAGIVKPYITRQPSDAMRFYEQAYATLFEWLNELPGGDCFQNIGALQLEERPYPDGHPRYTNLNATAASSIAGAAVQHDALFFKQAGWLSVETLCQALLIDVKQRGGDVVFGHSLSGLNRHNNSQLADAEPGNGCTGEWELNFSDAPTRRCKQVVLASGISLIDHEWLPQPDLLPARGQVTAFERDHPLNTVISGRHYAIPDEHCTWVGSTFDRGNADASLLAADDELNRGYANELFSDDGMSETYNVGSNFRQNFRQNFRHDFKNSSRNDSGNDPEPTQAIKNRFAGVRCTTLDRFPIVGPVPVLSAAKEAYHDIHHGRHLADYPSPSFHPGLAVMGGFGSRGITAAPYASVLLANWVRGDQSGHTDNNERATEVSSLNAENRLLSPLRFLIRRLKRSGIHR